MHAAVGLLLLALVASPALAYSSANGRDRILLSDIQVLTLNKDGMTSARRTEPIRQLQCTGGSASSRHDLYPSVVQCTNVGSDGSTVNWKCEATLDSSVQFGKLDVSCEGYNAPGDTSVLVGSCGLEYELQYAPRQQQQLPPVRPYYEDRGYQAAIVAPFLPLTFILIMAVVGIVVTIVRGCDDVEMVATPSRVTTRSRSYAAAAPVIVVPEPSLGPSWVPIHRHTTLHHVHSEPSASYWPSYSGSSSGKSTGYATTKSSSSSGKASSSSSGKSSSSSSGKSTGYATTKTR